MSMLSKNKGIFPILIFTILFGFAIFAQAAGLVPCSGPDCNVDSIWTLINNVIGVLSPIILSIAFALIVWAGILMITAGDDASKFTKGRNIILAVAIGILIIFIAKFAIISFVGGLGGNTTWFEQTIN